jgi:antitoxin component of MazEF toxin-antitoxin module
MTQKVIKTGNSIAVTIPAEFAKKTGIESGDPVKITTHPASGSITYTFINFRQLPLSAKILSSKS